MVALSTTAIVHISGKSFPTPPVAVPCQSLNWFVFPSSVVFVTQKRKPVIVKSSSAGESAAETTATEVEESENESSIEAPEGPPSLISALNVERALRGIR
uniref:Uncharacterized protein n=1 Tax=Rhizophora mucronata TaxID=61149 RepID=A0A2P2K433_RHIMU